MKIISEVSSLIKFQKRVLEKGTPTARDYSLDSLKDLLDFDSIFLSNTDEMFEKYNCKEIAAEYVNLLHQYIRNVGFIISAFNKVNPSGIKFTYQSSIEKRITEVSKFKDRYKLDWYNTLPASLNELNNGIYYVAFRDYGYNSIRIFQFDKSLYETSLHSDMIYWKTDDMILEYMNSSNVFMNGMITKFIEIKVTHKGLNAQKIEYNGDPEVMKRFLPYLNKNTLVVKNPYLFIDDIKLMIKDSIPYKEKASSKIKYDNVLTTLEKDELLEYPVESFQNYLNLLCSSVNNPNTKSISLTLYRIGNNPMIFNILKNAVDHGIEVNVNMELCASGEWINKIWADEMINAGMNVTTFKSGEMKVHSKLTLVEFDNGTVVAQIGTGNYHMETTRQYTDLSLMTSDQLVCSHIKSIFNMFKDDGIECEVDDDFIVTGIQNTNIGILLDLIDEQASLGQDGLICMKCNSLSDKTFIEHLNSAADKGCPIILIVRGICTWIPTQTNVSIRSIVWDKLEHSRVYSFGRENPAIYIGSLDLMTRKIKHRIEVLVRAKDPDIVRSLCDYMNRYITDINDSWIMQKDGTYKREAD